jgi:hypothetical protein
MRWGRGHYFCETKGSLSQKRCKNPKHLSKNLTGLVRASVSANAVGLDPPDFAHHFHTDHPVVSSPTSRAVRRQGLFSW